MEITPDMLKAAGITDMYDPRTLLGYSTTRGNRNFGTLANLISAFRTEQKVSIPVGGTGTDDCNNPLVKSKVRTADDGGGDCDPNGNSSDPDTGMQIAMTAPSSSYWPSTAPCTITSTTFTSDTSTSCGGWLLFPNQVIKYNPIIIIPPNIWAHCATTLGHLTEEAGGVAAYIINKGPAFYSSLQGAARTIASGKAIAPGAALLFLSECAGVMSAGDWVAVGSAVIGVGATLAEAAACIKEGMGG